MPIRDRAPNGAPCWTDLWTSDVETARTFYTQLNGWEALEPSSEFGGYFMFSRDGLPVAGAMGDMGEQRADDTWRVYLSTEDIDLALDRAQSKGATVLSPSMQVADLGSQALLRDPTGAVVGLWQPEAFVGFRCLGEPGCASWFELETTDVDRAGEFYSTMLGIELREHGDGQVRYLTMTDESGEELFGITDATGELGSVEANWSVYWVTNDLEQSLVLTEQLGGSVLSPPTATAYGYVATILDPRGARMRLHNPS